MDLSGNRAIVALLAIVVVLAGLVYLFGYPLLITVAVIAALASLVFIVVLSAGELLEKPSRPAEPEAKGRAQRPRSDAASSAFIPKLKARRIVAPSTFEIFPISRHEDCFAA